ncbi:MAG: response regulator transcription factor [Robiginitomaculum sp.]|nr:response regulator transcription factor [Robiginitomaculum sp.]
MLVEDDKDLANRISRSLLLSGFVVEHAYTGDDGYELGLLGNLSAAILDLGLPGKPGLEVLQSWRSKGIIMPVLVLTARSSWAEKVEGLNKGADDYMVKPFHTPELVARLRALIRRSMGKKDAVLVHQGLSIDTITSEARLGSEILDLTAFEFRMLKYFMHRIGHVVSQTELIEHLYPINETRGSNTIEVYIGRLRKKIGSDKIKTIRGLGYKFG